MKIQRNSTLSLAILGPLMLVLYRDGKWTIGLNLPGVMHLWLGPGIGRPRHLTVHDPNRLVG